MLVDGVYVLQMRESMLRCGFEVVFVMVVRDAIDDLIIRSIVFGGAARAAMGMFLRHAICSL
jgi:hypothetical protein